MLAVRVCFWETLHAFSQNLYLNSSLSTIPYQNTAVDMGNQFDLQALNPLAAGKRFLDHLISHLPKPAQNGQHQNAKGPETLRQKPLSAVDPITLPNQVEQTPYALPMAPPHPAFLGGKVSKEELGRATWTFLHTLAGQFPEHPTKQQQKDVKTLVLVL